MINSLWIAKTGMSAQQTQLDVISHNLANVSTTGFKKDRAVFEDLLYQNVKQVGAATSFEVVLACTACQLILAIAAGDLGQLGKCGIIGNAHVLRVATRTADQRGGHALLVIEQHLQHMLRRKLLMPFRQGVSLCRLQKTAHAFGVFLDIHRHSPLSPPCPHSAQVGWCG